MQKTVANILAMIPEMRDRFEAARSHYIQLQGESLHSLVRFEWCSDSRYSIQPFGIERQGWKPGRHLKTEPTNKDGKYRYGFSANERILLEEQYLEFEGQKYEQFWEYSQGRIDTTLFSYAPDKPVINVEATVFKDSRPIGFIRYADRGLCAEAYEYVEGLLVRALQVAQEHDPKSSKHKPTTTSDVFSYAGRQLSKVVRTWESGVSAKIYP